MVEDAIRDLYELGKEEFRKGNYLVAEDYLKQFVQENDNFADVFNMLGVIHQQKGRFREAIASFQRALKINPNYTEASLNLALTYNEVGEYQKGQELLTQARQTTTRESTTGLLDDVARAKLANMHADIADVYRSLGEYSEGIDEYRKALGLKPNFPDIRTKLGISLREWGRLEEAIKEFEQVKSLHPAYSPAGINLGIAFYSLGDLERARAEWEEVLKYNPNHPAAKFYLGLLEKKHGD
jgi:tetratricopeptide (TPR) repeat protein